MNKPFTPKDDYSETDREIFISSRNHSKNALANLSDALSKMKQKKEISNEESDIQNNIIHKSPLLLKYPNSYNNKGSAQNFYPSKIKQTNIKNSLENFTQVFSTTTHSIIDSNKLDTFYATRIVEKMKNTHNSDYSTKVAKPSLPFLPEALNTGLLNKGSLTSSCNIPQKFLANQWLTLKKPECKPHVSRQSNYKIL